MEQNLKEKLWDYIIRNDPDLMFRLQEEYKVGDYLDEKVKEVLILAEEMSADSVPTEITEEVCLTILTEDLKPCRFNYVSELLREKFEIVFSAYTSNDTLTFEVLQIMEYCRNIFEETGFSKETEQSPALKNAIVEQISSYLNKVDGKQNTNN